MDKKGKKLYDFLVEMGLNVCGVEKLNYARDPMYKIYYLFEEELPSVDMIIVVPEREFDFKKWELDNFTDEKCEVLRVSEIYGE